MFGEKMSEFLRAFQQDELNKKIEKEKQKMQEAKAKEEEEARLACPPRHPKYRVAMLVPLLGPVPGFLPYFIASAARASPLADFLIFHERTSMPGGTGTNTALTTHHPPPTTHHSPPTTHHAPPTTHHPPPPRTTHHAPSTRHPVGAAAQR